MKNYELINKLVKMPAGADINIMMIDKKGETTSNYDLLSTDDITTDKMSDKSIRINIIIAED